MSNWNNAGNLRGPQGDSGAVEVYEGTQQPDTLNLGSLWITEEQIPQGTTGPQGHQGAQGASGEGTSGIIGDIGNALIVGPNLLDAESSSFEGGTSGAWGVTGSANTTIEVVTGNATVGDRALAITDALPYDVHNFAIELGYTSSPIAVEPGEIYVFLADIFIPTIPTTIDAGVRVEWQWSAANEDHFSSAGIKFTLLRKRAGWHSVALRSASRWSNDLDDWEPRAPENAAFVRVLFDGWTNDKTVLLDNVRIHRLLVGEGAGSGEGGAQGSQGAQGHQGGPGSQGGPGTSTTGEQGAQGHQGSPGGTGEAGGPGAQGHQGYQGSAGELTLVTQSGASYTESTAPTIQAGEFHDFTSTALTALAFQMPATVDPSYRSALTFRTQVDTDRIKFWQAPGLWLEGRDCTDEGVFLPKAKAHYRIDFGYIRPRNATSSGDWKVRGVVSGPRFAGDFSLPQNGSSQISSVISLADAWFNTTQSYRPSVYGYDGALNEDWSGASQIDCSTFVSLVMRGITIENSKYASTGNSNNGPNTWANSMPRNASEQARWCVTNGWNFEAGQNWENVRGGDIIFQAQGAASAHGTWGTRYGWISHVQIADSDLEFTSAVPWEAGSISISTGRNLSASHQNVTNRARMTQGLPLPVHPIFDGLLLALPEPYCFISTHFYSWPDVNTWICSNGAKGLGFGYMGRRGRAWCPVPRGAAYFRCAVGKRDDVGNYLDIEPSEFSSIRLSYGRPAIYEVTTGTTTYPGAKPPFFHRGMSRRNLQGVRLLARPPLGGA